MANNALHIGKCSEELKLTVTPEFMDMLKERSSALRCHPSELGRDALYLAFTGATYACHVANDRRAAFQVEGRVLADSSVSDSDLNGEA